MNPDMGGLPEAMAIPKAKGIATNDTLTAANKSCFQYCLYNSSRDWFSGKIVRGWFDLKNRNLARTVNFL